MAEPIQHDYIIGPCDTSQCAVLGSVEAHDAVTTLPMALLETPEAPLDDTISLSGELECPICYQMYCDPIRAGCDRHVFCRNCLLRSQRGAPMTRCPICRCESRADVSSLPVAEDVLEKVQAKDPEYPDHLAAAQREREEYLKQLACWAAQNQPHALSQSLRFDSGWSILRGIPLREVDSAGTSEVNGIYAAGALPTYVGPPLYRKLNTSLFIFRWRQTRWVIAELRNSRSMGDEREWLYQAPVQWPEEVPPVRGWEVTPQNRGSRPAPQVAIYDDSANTGAHSEPNELMNNSDASSSTAHLPQVRTRCRGVVQVKCCTVM